MKIFIISDRDNIADITSDMLRGMSNSLEVETETGMDITEAVQMKWDFVLHISFGQNMADVLSAFDGYKVILQVKTCTGNHDPDACNEECSISLYSTLKLLILRFYEEYLEIA